MIGRNKTRSWLHSLIPFSGGYVLHTDTVLCEFGSVAPDWDFGELHDSMQSDPGPSLRIMANLDIGRLDLVWSEDDAAA